MTNSARSYWSMTEQTFYCLIDKKRTLSFKKAIQGTVKKDNIVVDAGTGTGILALFAADAGAKRVYAIENDSYHFKNLRKNIKLNGYSDKIVLIKGNAARVVLPEKVDVIICEMIATGLIEELQLPTLNHLLKYAKPKVRVVPNLFENYADLVFNNEIFYNHKLKIVRYEFPDKWCQKSIPLTDKVLYSRNDFSRINRNNKIDESIIMTMKRDGRINSLRISSKSIFFEGTTLEETYAYSYPIIFPIDDIAVKEGEKFTVHISYRKCEGLRNFKYTIHKI